MTAKELRLQASYIVEQWDNHDKFRMVEGDEAFMNADGEPDAVSFARHILANVRDDDDEPVSEEWFSTVLCRPLNQRFEFGQNYVVEMNQVDEWEVWLYAHCLRKIKTRGQFRSLCRGLGIELKEVDCAD